MNEKKQDKFSVMDISIESNLVGHTLVPGQPKSFAFTIRILGVNRMAPLNSSELLKVLEKVVSNMQIGKDQVQ